MQILLLEQVIGVGMFLEVILIILLIINNVFDTRPLFLMMVTIGHESSSGNQSLYRVNDGRAIAVQICDFNTSGNMVAVTSGTVRFVYKFRNKRGRRNYISGTMDINNTNAVNIGYKTTRPVVILL